MSRIRIYVEPGKAADFIKIEHTGTVHKIKNVLRLKEGDEVFVFDGAGKEYSCSIKYIQSDSVLLRLGDIVREQKRHSYSVALAFPLTKEEKVDIILQKCTELGVDRFIPFEANRGIKVKPSDAKMERWNNIIIEACRQSERLWRPKLEGPMTLDAALAQDYDQKIFADIGGLFFDKAMGALAKNILLTVGPEGDFSPEEKQALCDAGCVAVNIGGNILRLETAAIFLCGLAVYDLYKHAGG